MTISQKIGAAKGLGKPQAAYVLRHLANQWDPK